ncbi:MAG: mannose-phosphate guanylyltransferase [Actinomycetota bacterium]|nr:mannose-phosphate guanylyltransferase [Actinomycetota bacterium]
MKAVVLVGGEGTRLRPLTYTTPKPLLSIANQPHLERQLTWLAAHGVDEVVLSMGYLPDAFHQHFADDGSGRDVFGDVVLRYAIEKEPLGTAGAIGFAAAGIDERIIVCNGDVLTSLDLDAMVRFHDENGAEATISLTRVDDPSAFGVVPTQADGGVIAFVEKPAPGKAPSNWINAGTYVLEPAFLQRIPPRLNVSVERETFPRMLAEPGLLFGYQSDAYWLDIGTPQKYLEAHADALAGRLSNPPAPGAREASPGVWIQGGATIEPDAQIEAPVLIGDGARIEADARVRASVVGPGAVVESRAEVDGAVLQSGARVSHGSSVRDSVVGADAVLKPDVFLSAETIIGSGATVASGARISGGRVPAERE